MNRRELSEQEIQFIIDLYLDGYSISKVAKEAHVCRDYVKDILFRTYGDSVTILEVGRIILELLDNISK